MLDKGKKEQHGEEVQISAYKQFCDGVSVQTANAIEEANGKISVLKADAEKAVATLAKLTKEVAELEEAISTWNGDIKAATAVRNQEKTNYDTAVLKKSTADRKQSSLSVEDALIPQGTEDTIEAFLQQ